MARRPRAAAAWPSPLPAQCVELMCCKPEGRERAWARGERRIARKDVREARDPGWPTRAAAVWGGAGLRNKRRTRTRTSSIRIPLRSARREMRANGKGNGALYHRALPRHKPRAPAKPATPAIDIPRAQPLSAQTHLSHASPADTSIQAPPLQVASTADPAPRFAPHSRQGCRPTRRSTAWARA